MGDGSQVTIEEERSDGVLTGLGLRLVGPQGVDIVLRTSAGAAVTYTSCREGHRRDGVWT